MKLALKLGGASGRPERVRAGVPIASNPLSGSAGASWPAPWQSSPSCVERQPPPASTLFVPRALAVLTQADFEEYQQHGSAQASRHQDDGENLACDSSDEHGAHAAGDDERGGRPERQDA
jgi:hypothetical protein